MSTLAVVEEVLREALVPMTVKEIVARAGVRLPSKSKTPDTVVARDLSMDLKKKGEASRFARPTPGQYTLRELLATAPVATPVVAAPVIAAPVIAAPVSPVMSSVLRTPRAPTRQAPLAVVARPAGRVHGDR